MMLRSAVQQDPSIELTSNPLIAASVYSLRPIITSDTQKKIPSVAKMP